MTPFNARLTARVGLVLTLLLLASCATKPPAPQPPTTGEPVTEPAETLPANPEQAAEELEQAAAEAPPERRATLLLQAAELRLGLAQAAQARTLLERVAEPLSETQRQYRQILLARLQLAEGQPDAAAISLQAVSEPAGALRRSWLIARAEILAAANQPLQAAEARAALDPLLPPHAQADNRTRTWALLSATSMEALRARMPPPPDAFGGWLELSYLYRTYRLDLKQLVDALQKWRERYPDHPAAEVLLPELLASRQELPPAPQRIALLLPLSGELAGPAQAIRDGFLAAYYAAGTTQRPEIRIYDTAGNASTALATYDQAVAEGADFIVGPLAKEAVLAVAARGNLPVPVLALNALSDFGYTPPGLFQFGLAPEDEARAAAALAHAQGHDTAVMLVPAGDWGTRVAQAYAEAFEAVGGTVLETARYPAEANDYSAAIEAVFNLDASEVRARQLRRELRRDVHFEPRRRQDVDVVFVGAYPRQGRLMRPQLKFFRALDLPVIATSHIYSGSEDARADQDLNDTGIVEMPWILRPGDGPLSRSALAALRPDVNRLPRFYALGIDAYGIIPHLHGLQLFPGESVEGMTGVLALDSQNRLYRRLYPARFVNGRVVGQRQLEQQAFGSPARDHQNRW